MKKTITLISAFCLLGMSMSIAQWQNVGPAGFSSKMHGGPVMGMDANNVPYVVYQEDANFKVTVMKYVSGAWSVVGSSGFSGQWGGDGLPIVIDASGNVYVAMDNLSQSYAPYVYKFNGTSWSPIISGLPAWPASVDYISMAISPANEVYVAYGDEDLGSGQVTVKKFNGTSWVTVGASLFSGTVAYQPQIAIDKNGTPYVAYVDGGWGKKGTVMKYNGSAWVTVGSKSFTLLTLEYINLAIDNNGTPYVGYYDNSSGNVTVMKFNGTSWGLVGPASFASGDYGTIAFDPTGAPCISKAHPGSAGQKMAVLRWNGTTWSYIGPSTGFSVGATYAGNLIFNSSGMPYVCFWDIANGDKVTVMNYSGSIGIDETNAKNLTMSIHSNPVSDFLSVEVPNSIGTKSTFQIYDMLGKEVSGKVIARSGINQLDVSDLKQGIYLLALKEENEVATKKFVKE